MADRKLIFNIYDELPKGKGKKPITKEHLALVLNEIPFTGVTIWTFADESKLVAAKRNHVKTEIYDVYWN